mmetsp:Transcript_114275/g.210018  ORF Transcript_114275/g.210018 Transcript_114275/m.210018 type:complete len:85 (-) Transcript_114275:512-766(-)
MYRSADPWGPRRIQKVSALQGQAKRILVLMKRSICPKPFHTELLLWGLCSYAMPEAGALQSGIGHQRHRSTNSTRCKHLPTANV